MGSSLGGLAGSVGTTTGLLGEGLGVISKGLSTDFAAGDAEGGEPGGEETSGVAAGGGEEEEEEDGATSDDSVLGIGGRGRWRKGTAVVGLIWVRMTLSSSCPGTLGRSRMVAPTWERCRGSRLLPLKS